MSVIFPGNYVAQLNAYREQGCVSLPGVEFYRAVGALVLNPDNDSVTGTTTDGVLDAGTYGVQVLSPDLRQDDKPRKDKPLTVPSGSVVYRTAISAPGVKAAASGDTAVIATAANLPTAVPVTAGTTLAFPAAGAVSALSNILGGTAVASDTVIQVTTSADFTCDVAGTNSKSPSAILVEVCYYRAAPAPDAEDAHIPFAVEAGQGY